MIIVWKVRKRPFWAIRKKNAVQWQIIGITCISKYLWKIRASIYENLCVMQLHNLSGSSKMEMNWGRWHCLLHIFFKILWWGEPFFLCFWTPWGEKIILPVYISVKIHPIILASILYNIYVMLSCLWNRWNIGTSMK